MKKLLPVAAFLFSVTASAQINSFSININGTVPTGFAQAMNLAAQKWSNYLQITVPVKVNVFTVNAGFLPFSAITLANGRQNFANAPVANYLYPTALANQLAGSELNTGEFDMDIYFNLATSYYYGSGKPAANQRDFVTTAMHEMGHGLGFYSAGYVDNSGKGSFGNVPQSTIFPLQPSFPWRGQDGVPGIYDKYLVKTSGNTLTACAPNNSTTMGDSIKYNRIYFNGPAYANASHSLTNMPIRLAGGEGAYTLGVDILHIHDSYANTIMSYYWGDGDTVRIPAPWELGMLKEMGWNMKVIGLTENTNFSVASVYPNPANSRLYVTAEKIREVSIYSIQGQLLNTQANALQEDQLEISTEHLPDGVYFYKVLFTGDERPVFNKMVIRH